MKVRDKGEKEKGKEGKKLICENVSGKREVKNETSNHQT